MGLGLDGLFDQAAEYADVWIDSGDVAKYVDFGLPTLQSLFSRGLVDFRSENTGKRTFRKFSVPTLPMLVLAEVLQKSGLSASEAIRAAKQIVARTAEILEQWHRRPNEADRPFEFILWNHARHEVSFSSNCYPSASVNLDELGRISISIPLLRARIRQVLELCLAAHSLQGFITGAQAEAAGRDEYRRVTESEKEAAATPESSRPTRKRPPSKRGSKTP
jgi:hypothetical protein